MWDSFLPSDHLLTDHSHPGATVINPRHLTPILRTSLTEEIIKRLITLIVDDGLKPGDKLPPSGN
jgi:hypothetical protein